MKKYIYLLILVLFVFGLIWLIKTPGKPGQYDDFARCLTEKGAVFYGTFWCPHCQAQKSAFGKSFQYVKYVECSTPDGQSQLQVCKDVNITSYPTWEFNASSTDRLFGEVELSVLSEKTGCELSI